MYTYLTRLPDCNPGLDEVFLCCLHDDHRHRQDCEHNSEHQHHAVMIVNVQQLQRHPMEKEKWLWLSKAQPATLCRRLVGGH